MGWKRDVRATERTIERIDRNSYRDTETDKRGRERERDYETE